MQLNHFVQKTLEHISTAVEGRGQVGLVKFDLPFNPAEGKIDLVVGEHLARVSFEVIVAPDNAKKDG